jgi:TolB-like protein/class 3 adenylate cyclase
MSEKRAERRLAAILAADIAGYSRLMGLDEEGTLARLKAHRRELVDPTIREHRGRIVKTTGDGMLVEFASPVEAARCAVEVQRAMLDRNADIPVDKRILFRVGINLGDVIAEDGDLFGDGVNVAARLESLSEPGGLCLSRPVHDQVRDKLPYPFEDAGEHTVKNIARPVGVFALSMDAVAALPAGSATSPVNPTVSLRVKAIAAALASLAVLAGGAWLLRSRLEPPPPVVSATAPTQATPAAPRQAPRLSIVVLPFSNLSSDPEQEYFADGITEDLTTDLSRISGSFIIARNSAFTYKGKAVDVRQVGRDLGVRYALEGSVRRIGDKVRVNAQLIDAETGGHLWTDRFEGEVARLAILQTEVTGRLARSLDLEMTSIESQRGQRERPNNPNAVDLSMRGWAVFAGPRTRDNSDAAARFFEQALEIDPDHVDALIGLGRTLAQSVTSRFHTGPSEAVLERAEAVIKRAIVAAPRNAQVHVARAEFLRAHKKFDEAGAAYEKAIELNPNLAPAHANHTINSILAGRAAEAFSYVDKALRLSPQDPQLHLWYFYKCHAYAHLGQDDAAIELCRKSVAITPFWLAYVDLISAYGHKGMRDEARAAMAELDKLKPGYTVKHWASEDWSDSPTFKAEYARIVEGLRKAGMREE